MGIRKEYVCFAHGPFEADSPVCPEGCTTAVERQFRTAPGIRSNRTRNIDSTLTALAKDFGLSDLSNRNGSVAQSQRAPQDMRPTWGNVPKGDVFKQGGVIESVQGSKGGAETAAQQVGVHDPASAHAGFTEVAKMMKQPKADIDPKFVYGDRKLLSETVAKS